MANNTDNDGIRLINTNLTEQHYRQPSLQDPNPNAEVTPLPNNGHTILKCRSVFFII